MNQGASTGRERGAKYQLAVDAVTPRWATVRFARLEQSPELCASPALTASQKGGSMTVLGSLFVVVALFLVGTNTWG